MKFYTIQNNTILTAENQSTLTRFYNNVLPLPDDYETGKYIVEEGILVINPNYENEKAQKEKQLIIKEIITRLNELDLKRIRAICEKDEIKDIDTGKTWLEYYNEQVQELREEFNKLTS